MDRRLPSSRDDRRRDRDGDRGTDRGDRRRRSRSPGHRSRGTYQESDSYSSSRDYREREREQRYGGNSGGGGGGRERHGWDRDRGSARRDARRDDDGGRRDSRRDRDLFSDNRRPREEPRDADREKDTARDRDDLRQMERQARQKSASPERKPREPTPDLTDYISILNRKRRLPQWDLKPPGYDNITAEKAKLSGMFPLPGAPRAQPMDQSRLQAFMNSGNQASKDALKPSSARQSKRLIIYNVPVGSTDNSISDFFNLHLNGLNVTKGTDPCISAHVGESGNYALAEFKTPEDATNAMALDGTATADSEAMDTTNGTTNGTSKGLQIRRPKDYIVPIQEEGQHEAGLFSGIVPDSQSKVMITSLPIYLTEEQVQELLQSFGELRSFILAKDTGTEQCRGFAFCEYADPAVTDAAVEGLNGMELGDVALKVQRACVGIQQASGEISVNAMSLMAGAQNGNGNVVSRVVCLMNMITMQELMDNDEADEILEDVKEECEKYGHVLETKMPRSAGSTRNTNGLGKIYIKYEDVASAQKALAALAGRKFADRTVVATVFGEEYFDVNAW